MTRAGLSESERAALIEELARARFGAGAGAGAGAEAGAGAGSSAGELDAASNLTAHRRSPSCGDEFTVRLSVTDDVITALRWDGHGCVVSTAAAGMLAHLAAGVAVGDFPGLAFRYLATLDAGTEPDPELGDAEVFAGIGRYPLRAGCASLAWRAALDALAPPASAGRAEPAI